MFTLNTQCGTWIQSTICDSPGGPVTTLKEWNYEITELLSTRYILMDGTVTDEAPEGLVCFEEPFSKVYVKQFNVDNAGVGQDTFTDPLFEKIPVDGSTGLHGVDVILDGRNLYENDLFNWFTKTGDTIVINQTLTDGVQLTIKFYY